MWWSRFGIRDGVGAALSASFTLLVFGLPVCALLLPPQSLLAETVLGVERAQRFVTLVAPAADQPSEAWARRTSPGIAGPPAPEPPEPAPPEEPLPPDDSGAESGEGGEADADASGSEPSREPTAGSEAAEAAARRVDLGVARSEGAELGEPADGEGDGGTSARERMTLLRFGGARRGRTPRCKKTHAHIEPADGMTRVNRSLVAYYTSSWSRLTSLGWSGRYKEDDTKGWKITGFGCNSPLYFAGFRRGDVIQSVNGRPTRNVLQVFNTYRKLERYDDFEVVVLRKGEVMSLRYRLQDGPPYTG